MILHGFKGFKDWGFFPKIAERLARAGLTAVSFNHSGSGVGVDGDFSEPERFSRNTYSNQVRDLGIVIAALEQGRLLAGLAPPFRIGLLGHSMGGAAAVLYAAGHDRVRTLVTWSAVGEVVRWDAATRSKWREDGKLDIVNARTGQVLPLGTDLLDEIEGGLSITAAAAEVKCPWLIVHSDADEAVPLGDGRALAAAGNGELLVVEGGGHTFGVKHPWAGSTPQYDGVANATLEHLLANLSREV